MKNDKRCTICGASLPPHRSKYCSDDCARIAENMLTRARTAARHVQPKRNTSLYRKITCPDCGQECEVHIRSIRCPACQAEADRRHNEESRQRKRAGTARIIGGTDLCARCGSPYIIDAAAQRYCKACAAIATHENRLAAARAYNRAAYADPVKRAAIRKSRSKPAPPPAICPVCKTSFQPLSPKGVYCSRECYAKARKDAAAQYYQRRKARKA